MPFATNHQRDRVFSFDKSFQKALVIANPEKGIRVVLAGLGDKKKLSALLAELSGPQPASIVFIEGAENALFLFAKELGGASSTTVSVVGDDITPLESGKIYVADFKKCFARTQKRYVPLRASFLIYGEISKHASAAVAEWVASSKVSSGASLLLEDLGARNSDLMTVAADIVPSTSFAYMSSQYLGQHLGQHPGKKP